MNRKNLCIFAFAVIFTSFMMQSVFAVTIRTPFSPVMDNSDSEFKTKAVKKPASLDTDLFNVKKIRTQHDYYADFKKLLLKRIKESFPEATAGNMDKFLEQLIYAPIAKPEPVDESQLPESLKKLIQEWNNYVKSKYKTDDFFKCIKGMDSMQWIKVLVFRIRYTANSSKDNYKILSDEFALLIKQEADSIESSPYLYRLTGIIEDMADNLKTDGKNGVSAEPWLYKMLLGYQAKRQAWKSRGGGWARNVTDDGWKGWQEKMPLSSKYFKEAHAMHPEYPEAAAEMIENTICDNTEDNAQVYYWLKQVVEAQVDYERGFRFFYWFTLPRWCGDLKTHMQLAWLCLNADIPGSGLPVLGLEGMRIVAADTRNYKYQLAFPNSYYQKAVEAFDKVEKNPELCMMSRNGLPSLRINLECCFQNYDESMRLLAATGEDNYYKTNGMGSEGLGHFKWIDACAKTKAFTGQNKDKFKAAEEAHYTDRDTNALSILIEIINDASASKEDRLFALNTYGMYKEPIETRHINAELPYVFELITDKETRENANSLPVIYELIELTAKCGAINDIARNKRMLLEYALVKNVPDPIIEKIIQSGADLNAVCGADRITALHCALACRASVKTVERIIDGTNDINMKSKYYNYTPLLYATSCKYPSEIIEKLLQKGADPNCRSSYTERTPVFDAVFNNDPKTLRLLLDCKSDPNAKGKDGYTPIQCAAGVKDIDLEICRMLLKAGADINAQEPKKKTWTALSYAVRESRTALVKYLVENGADLKTVDGYGKTAMDYALQKKNNEIIEYLKSMGAPASVELK